MQFVSFRTRARLRSGSLILASTGLAVLVCVAAAQNKANWKLAERFNSAALQPFVYSSTVNPGWIGETDTFWYSWRDENGTKFYLVDPAKKSKKPLFDSAKMASQLSELMKKPYDTTNLPINTLTFARDGKKFNFTVERRRFEYDMATEKLRELEAPAAGEGAPAGGPPGGQGRGGGRGQFGQGGPGGQGRAADYRNFSPDRKSYVYAENHNLYFVDMADEKNPIQLTKDGADDYSFGIRRGGNNNNNDEDGQENQQGNAGPRVRANVTWSPDSKTFYVSRMDMRNVKELYLVNSLAEPRPTLMSYKYAMPGEPEAGNQEVFFFEPDKKALRKVDAQKYHDQRLFEVHWLENSDRLRFVRRDRTQRKLELCDMDPKTSNINVLISEEVETGFLERQPVRYFKKKDQDFVWWSERDGWGHLYLYDSNGKLKNRITEGPWRVEGITAVDEDKGTIWFTAVGREAGENPYYRHLYKVDSNGKNLKLLDAGNSDHNTRVSPSRKFYVDTFSTVSEAPKTCVCDENGNVIMMLEEQDMRRLSDWGWKPPTDFMVKSADGITDIYGVMWKPIDFDPNKQYPIIAHVYPGPQTESVISNFSPTNMNQRLANLGFIVVQIGNRGGNPRRSNAYHSYGYFNLRDYGLADKKAGIEQLAAKYPWMDVDKVGIYGHSGGGFMTAAALLLPPYNDFFKVGVSSAGNHDNNVYNANWSEQHHGLKEVKDKDGKIKYEIKVPTNTELAANLKGNLLLVHGDMDNNVHPAGTIRLANALIKANKRFDFMIMPGQAHGFGPYTNYFNQMLMEYFAKHLLGDRIDSAEMTSKN